MLTRFYIRKKNFFVSFKDSYLEDIKKKKKGSYFPDFCFFFGGHVSSLSSSFTPHKQIQPAATPFPPTPTPLQQQPKSRHLKRPQLNLDLPTLPPQFLPIILQQIRLTDLLHPQRALQHAAALPAQALVDPYDHAPAFALGELAARDVGVVFAALDGVEDQGGGAGEGDGVEEGGGGAEGGGGRGRVDLHWVVKVVGCPDGARIERAGVREDGVPDRMSACGENGCVSSDIELARYICAKKFDLEWGF